MPGVGNYHLVEFLNRDPKEIKSISKRDLKCSDELTMFYTCYILDRSDSKECLDKLEKLKQCMKL